MNAPAAMSYCLGTSSIAKTVANSTADSFARRPHLRAGRTPHDRLNTGETKMTDGYFWQFNTDSGRYDLWYEEDGEETYIGQFFSPSAIQDYIDMPTFGGRA
jgi:hypothetical protein